MRILQFATVLVLAAAAIVGPGVADANQAQVVNPLFAQAQEIASAVAASTLADDAKANFAQRFAALSSEQQNLWALAGQVDAGQCTDSCVVSYNNEIDTWQNALVAFSADASAALPQGHAEVTLQNNTSGTLDLYIDNQQQCEALFNLTCTAETSSGFHLLVGASGDKVAGQQSVNLKSGESYTFTVQ
jgi:hypothetical protein